MPTVKRRFVWDIFNPFLPWRKMEASFYHGFPTLTHWKVILDPRDRHINSWDFSFLLKQVKSSERESDIVAENLSLFVVLNGNIYTVRSAANYHFCERNLHTWHNEVDIDAKPRKDKPHVLAFEISISFPGQNSANQEGNGLIFKDEDLSKLSQNLQRLLVDASFANMRMMTTDQLWAVNVHSFIIRERWDNFFSKHDFEAAIGDGVDTNISDDVLTDILIYMYSGSVNLNWRYRGNVPYTAELFRVIDRYQLYHLYKVFSKNDLLQTRSTGKDLMVDSVTFTLDDDNCKRLEKPAYMQHFNYNHEEVGYQIRVKIQFYMNTANPWFHYILQSWSPFRLHAQVNLELKEDRISIGERGRHSFDTETVASVHEMVYVVAPSEEVQSGTCHFEGLPEDFELKTNPSTESDRYHHFIVLTLSVSRGTVVNNIWSRNPELQNDQERYNVLSDHMRLLQQRVHETDLRVICSNQNNPGFNEDCFDLHKAIFIARVPRWREVLGNIPEGMEIPEEVRVPLRSEVLQSALDYIYTGKVSSLPSIDEMNHFAEQSGLVGLQDLIRERRGGPFRRLFAIARVF